jgi:hypothetical protein
VSAARKCRVPEPVLARIAARLGARAQSALPIVWVVLRQHQRGKTSAQIAGWMAATFGPDNPAADEGFIRFVLAATAGATTDTTTAGTAPAAGVAGGEEPRWQPGSPPSSPAPTTHNPWAGTRADTEAGRG